ncbi:MAG: nuclear transport factor 2 family protein [Betaproteobacteria bacterium]
MPHVWIRTAVFALLPLLASFGAAAAETGAQAVDNAWVKAMKANDLDAVLKTYAADATVWLPGVKESRGQKAIRAAYEGMLSANTVKNVVLSDTHYKSVGDTSVGWGRFVLTLAPKAGGEPVVLTGQFTDIAQRIGGRWVYIVDHASTVPPPAAGAK